MFSPIYTSSHSLLIKRSQNKHDVSSSHFLSKGYQCVRVNSTWPLGLLAVEPNPPVQFSWTAILRQSKMTTCSKQLRASVPRFILSTRLFCFQGCSPMRLRAAMSCPVRRELLTATFPHCSTMTLFLTSRQSCPFSFYNTWHLTL